MQRYQTPQYLQRLLQEVHTDTWYKLPHRPEVARTNRGSRPGSPIADLIWNALMADVHIETSRILEDIPQIKDQFEHLGITPQGVTWADDLAVPVLVDENPQLIPTTVQVMQRLQHAFKKKGLTINYKKGKTMAVPTFRGKGAPALRKMHMHKEDSAVPIPLLDLQGRQTGETANLRLTSSYKHLGVIYTPEAGYAVEIGQRLGQASAAYNEIKRPIFSNRHISVAARLRLLDALVFTKLLFGAAIWHDLPRRALDKIESFIMRLTRHVVHAGFQAGALTDEEIRIQHNLPTLRQRLVRIRLLYVAKLWTVGPRTLTQLLEVEQHHVATSWCSQIERDLQWLRTTSTAHSMTPLDWTSITALWKADGRGWANEIRRSVLRAVQQEHAMSEVRAWHYDIVQALQPAVTFNFDPKDIGLAVAQVDSHQCECGQRFRSLRGLQVHRYKKHGQHAPEYFLTDSTICPNCLQQFWTMGRVRQHLSYMPRDGTANICYAALVARGVHVERQAEGEVSKVPASARGINRLDAIRTSGPMRPPPSQNESALQDAAFKLRLLEQQAHRRHLHHPEAELRSYPEWESLSEATRRWCNLVYDAPGERSTDEEVYQLQALWHEALPVAQTTGNHPWEAIFYRWGRSDIAEFMTIYSDGWTEVALEKAFSEVADAMELPELEAKWDQAKSQYNRLVMEQDQPPQPHRPIYKPMTRGGHARRGLTAVENTYNEQEIYEANFALLKIDYTNHEPELPLYKWPGSRKCYLVLHLFSGRRREGDLHDHLQRMATGKDYDIKVYSMDLAVDDHYGDLSPTSEAWARVKEGLTKGIFAAGLAGSPCNTYSEARYHQPVDTARKWPRPVRNRMAPWGLPHLSKKELRHVRMGTVFAMEVMWTFAMMYRGGGIFLSEHPWIPSQEDRVSVWRLPVFQLLAQLPGLRLHCIPQGLHGAKSWKRTGIAALRCPKLAQSMRKWRTDYTPPESDFIGMDSEGRYKTAILKEYPMEFSGGLAQVLIDEFDRKHAFPSCEPRAVQADLHDWLSRAAAALGHIRHDADMRPDLV